jgi:hypothetical protein
MRTSMTISSLVDVIHIKRAWLILQKSALTAIFSLIFGLLRCAEQGAFVRVQDACGRDAALS